MPDAIPETAALTRLYVVGDSISMHYGPYLQAYVAGRLCYRRKGDAGEDSTDLDLPAGANGGDSSMVLGFLEACKKVGGIQADILLVNCGLHDIKVDPCTGEHQVPIQDYRQNLLRIVDVVAGMAPQMVWVRTTPCDEAVHNKPTSSFHRFAADCNAYNAAADTIMADAGIPMIDLHTFTVNLGDDLYCDHVHFPVPIREKQAAFVAGWLDAYLAPTRSA